MQLLSYPTGFVTFADLETAIVKKTVYIPINYGWYEYQENDFTN